MREFEIDIVRNNELGFMNYFLTQFQFTEDFLGLYRNYYDGNLCLKYQKNLSLNFCITFLFNVENGVCYYDLVRYFRNKYSENEIRRRVFIS